MKIFLSSLGCRLNEAELQMWANSFVKYGHQLVSQATQADLVIFNSCTVTAEAARKSRKTVRRFHRDNPTVKIVVTGCYSSMESQEILEQLPIDLIVPNLDKDQLAACVHKQFAASTVVDTPSTDTSTTASAPVSASATTAAVTATSITPLASVEQEELPTQLQTLNLRGMQRSFIKIQDGCRYRCSFCIVTLARGDERSRTPEVIIDEITQLVAEGVNEVVLTGVHIGGYGSDIALTLDQLIIKILQQTQIPRLRIASLEPWNLSDALFELFKNSRLMPHIHLPMQSGANAILKKMARRGDFETVCKIVEKFRSIRADISISTDIIVGFPGETAQDWQQTLSAVKQLAFSQLHIFPFSPRANTVAATLPNRIKAEIVKERCYELEQLNAQLQADFAQQFVGTKQRVLLENLSLSKQGENGFFALTPHFVRAWVGGFDNNRQQFGNSQLQEISGKIATVKISHYDQAMQCLHGQVIAVAADTRVNP